MRPRALRLNGHQRPPLRGQPPGRDVVLRDAEGRQLVLRQVDAAESPVLAYVPHDVDELQRDAERLRALDVLGAVHRDARDTDGAGDLFAIAAEIRKVGVARLLGVLQAAVHERRERVT